MIISHNAKLPKAFGARNHAERIAPCDKITRFRCSAERQRGSARDPSRRRVQRGFGSAGKTCTLLLRCVDCRLMEAGLIHFRLEYCWSAIVTSDWVIFSFPSRVSVRAASQRRKAIVCLEHQLNDRTKRWRGSVSRGACGPRRCRSRRASCRNCKICPSRFVGRTGKSCR